MTMRKSNLIYDFTFDELSQLLQTWGEPAYRATQIWEFIYQSLIDSPENFSNIPKTLRKKLQDDFSFSGLNPIDQIQSSGGQTSKTLFELVDGKRIETVLMNYRKRNTLCISSQAGCAMNCSFCATGQMGFSRNLTAGEIIEQVLYFARILQARGEAVTNIVYMGMGEPLHNYDAVMQAIETLNHSQGFNLGSRRFTISTVGLIPGIKKFTQEKSQVNLAVSLHSSNNQLRSSMMPVNNKYPIEELINACRQYVEITGRRITFEWALIQDVNDTIEEAKNLAKLLQGMICHVNVIPLNPTKGFDGQKSNRERVLAFKRTLES
ncbi:MAG: 23S rRNA (adenine(2503)-C(2))-methyltransferase RlmN, partial [Aliifodinibius sp.]|nr:23S rRNA (adenine(2503)-C(2))-methyltransferase RlmN [Fodinibius sp.]